MTDRKRIQVAAKLYDCQETAQRLTGDRYDVICEPYREVIRNLAAKSGVSHLKAGMELMRTAISDGQDTVAMWAGAAIVDLVENEACKERE